MSDLTNIEKLKLEKLFRMKDGYVLDFSNKTFKVFIQDSTGLDIYDKKYAIFGDSKANRLRAFWRAESNHTVGRFLSDLIEFAKEMNLIAPENPLVGNCVQVAERLRQDVSLDGLEIIASISPEQDFRILYDEVKNAIKANKPAAGLDRLHTFATKFIRETCKKHGIVIDNTKPLHSLMGEYLKHLRDKNMIETEMTHTILKSCISLMEKFSHVRNEKSLAHPNSLLNHEESLLILRQVSSVMQFVFAIEKGQDDTEKQIPPDPDDDLPF